MRDGLWPVALLWPSAVNMPNPLRVCQGLRVGRLEAREAIYSSAGGSDSRGQSGDRCRSSFVRQTRKERVRQTDEPEASVASRLLELPALPNPNPRVMDTGSQWEASMDDGKVTGDNAPRRASLEWLEGSGMRGGSESRRVSRTLQDGFRNERPASGHRIESMPRVG